MTNNLTNTRCGDYYIPNIKKGRLTEQDAKILQKSPGAMRILYPRNTANSWTSTQLNTQRHTGSHEKSCLLFYAGKEHFMRKQPFEQPGFPHFTDRRAQLPSDRTLQ